MEEENKGRAGRLGKVERIEERPQVERGEGVSGVGKAQSRKERHCTGNLKGEMFKGERYIPAWWKNSGHGNGKTTGKIPVWWEISLRGRENFFWFMEALVLAFVSM